jgi:hypothetical protein
MPGLDHVVRFTRVFESLRIRYMVTGSVASIIYGEPRLTLDVDFVVSLKSEDACRIEAAFPLTEFYCPPEEILRVEIARDQRGHFNIIESKSGFKADIYLVSRDPLHAWGLTNALRKNLGDATIMVAPPEYVIVRKLEFYLEGRSEKHLRDIRSMLAITPEIQSSADLERLICERRLDEPWRLVIDTHA